MESVRTLRRFSWTFIVAMLAAFAPVSSVSAQGTWASLTPVPATFIGVEGMQVEQIGNQIIAAYGYDGGDTNLTRIYDIDQDTWSVGAAAPLPVRSEGAAAAHGGAFYAVGGRSATVLANLERYLPAINTWTSMPPMPTARAGLATAVVGKHIYAIGGRQATGGPCSGLPLATVERYDTAKKTWSTVAPLLSARSDPAAYAHGGKIYVMGGCSGFGGGTALNDVDVYDPVTDTWSAAPADMPTARAAFYAVGGSGDTIYAIGGYSGVQLSTNEAYDIAADAWSADTPMPTPRAEMGLVSHGGRIYTVGGGAFGASSSANEVFKP